MTTKEVLEQIEIWVKGNDWLDWKTRIVSYDNTKSDRTDIVVMALLLQREINQYRAEVLFDNDNCIYVMAYPSCDDMFNIQKINGVWLIDGKEPLTQTNIKKKLDDLESSRSVDLQSAIGD